MDKNNAVKVGVAVVLFALAGVVIAYFSGVFDSGPARGGGGNPQTLPADVDIPQEGGTDAETGAAGLPEDAFQKPGQAPPRRRNANPDGE